MLLGAADALGKSIPNYESPKDTTDFEGRLNAESIEAARSALGAELFALAWSAGREIPREQALDMAIAAVRRRLAAEGQSPE